MPDLHPCEDFYRRGDRRLFYEAASLEEIIRILDNAPANHPYNGVIEDLRVGDHAKARVFAHLDRLAWWSVDRRSTVQC